ncbi:hypothetical protein ILUMI_05354 [Ignelater luminosus]|uniref:Uncharacterized protein n=1 Tax=Ignelater luminosus TaxID=2038154 RepID=A0A8K0D783_IGNLU|nr:hypothetical protein ILUMI_05354 [Ignelater luminosus]
MMKYRSAGSSKEKKEYLANKTEEHYEAYKNARTAVKLAARQAERTSWEEFGRFKEYRRETINKRKENNGKMEKELLEETQIEKDISEDEPNLESQLTAPQIKTGVAIEELEFVMKKLKLGTATEGDRIAPKMEKVRLQSWQFIKVSLLLRCATQARPEP